MIIINIIVVVIVIVVVIIIKCFSNVLAILCSRQIKVRVLFKSISCVELKRIFWLLSEDVSKKIVIFFLICNK